MSRGRTLLCQPFFFLGKKAIDFLNQYHELVRVLFNSGLLAQPFPALFAFTLHELFYRRMEEGRRLGEPLGSCTVSDL